MSVILRMCGSRKRASRLYDMAAPLRNLWRWQGTVLPLVLSRVEIWFFLLLHVALVIVREYTGYDVWGDSPISVLTIPSAVLAFFLVFFNGHCYARFTGFYGATTGMMGATQELIELISVHLADEPVARWDAIRYAVSSILLTYYKVR